MGILQAAYRTYENQSHMVGVIEEGKEPLTPVSHAILNAHIEIVITPDGEFKSARPIAKTESKTIIPVTVESANRTGNNTKAHPLCDQLRYLASFGGPKIGAYLVQLEQWVNSKFVHPKASAVLTYIKGDSITSDLASAGIITLDDKGNPGKGKIEGTDYEKCLIRWHVNPSPDGIRTACWEDTTLFACYTAFYASILALSSIDICFISGQQDIVSEMHPKGVVSHEFGAKLASSNDKTGFAYRGRFTTPQQAYSIGYNASQKAHHALRWIASNQGVTFGGRTFLCWNTEGIEVPTNELFGFPNDEPRDFVSYKRHLFQTLSGYKQALSGTSGVVIASVDAATTGRLSVTYYNELIASDFLDRVEDWYSTLCINTKYGVRSPTLKQIADCAFGTQRGTFIESDDAVLKERVQQLLHCMLDKKPLPIDLVRALATRASFPLAYKDTAREIQLTTACAVIRKSLNDKKEEWTLALDPLNTNRSYLFGRLLAVAEHVERKTYKSGEDRETNAIRMQSVFAQRPLYAWRLLEEKLVPYFASLVPGPRNYFKNIIAEIADKLPSPDSPELGKKLEDLYLLGYYHQRSALTHGKSKTDKEETDNESTNE